MATYTATWQGKVKFCKPLELDFKFATVDGEYATLFYPDPKSLEEIKALINGSPPIKNKLKKDDDGAYFIRLSCKPKKVINGQVKVFRVTCLEADGKTAYTGAIGHGSDVTIEVEVYTYRKGEGKALRWKSVRIDNLVEYTPQMKEMQDPPNMADTPPPVWG